MRRRTEHEHHADEDARLIQIRPHGRVADDACAVSGIACARRTDRVSSRHPTDAAREAGGEMDEALVERVGAEASGRSMRRHALGRRHAADDEHADDEAVDGDDAGHDDGNERFHHQIGTAASARVLNRLDDGSHGGIEHGEGTQRDDRRTSSCPRRKCRFPLCSFRRPRRSLNSLSEDWTGPAAQGDEEAAAQGDEESAERFRQTSARSPTVHALDNDSAAETPAKPKAHAYGGQSADRSSDDASAESAMASER